MSDMNMNSLYHSGEHKDLQLAARNAVAAYMHHVFFDKTGKAPTTMSGAIIHAATEYCLKSAIQIIDKAVAQVEKSV